MKRYKPFTPPISNYANYFNNSYDFIIGFLNVVIYIHSIFQ